MKRLVVATKNRGKLVEIQKRLANLDYEITSLRDHDKVPSIIEDAQTFEGNAIIKARAVVRHLGLPALADDSGLEVDALDGRPGVHSARYGGSGLNDGDRIAFLLKELADVPKEERRCRFRVALAHLDPAGKKPHVFWGVLEGTVAMKPSGSHGFGYDPVFIPAGHNETLAVLGPTVKDRISHRAQALDKLVNWLNQFDRH